MMSPYRARVADAMISRALDTFGAVIVQGPRAAGKTTTALHAAASSVRLDAAPNLIALAETSPGTILTGETPRLIDEWQLAPTIWNAVRHEVDVRNAPGQFILTGSATPRDDTTRHSGAGRFKRIDLRTMSLSESGESLGGVPFNVFFDGGPIAALGGPRFEDYAEFIIRGGWPALVSNSSRDPRDYLLSYLDDIARVDLPAADTVIDPVRMMALLHALSRNIATEMPAARLGREAQIDAGTELSAQTARKYLDALSRVFVLEELTAWRPHLRSKVRVRVQPKWHFADVSLAAALLGADTAALMADLNTLGLLFESLCIRDLRIYAEPLRAGVFHYRDETGLEVDAIVEAGDGAWAAFEVKLGGARQIDEAVDQLRKLAGKVSPEKRARLASLNVLTAGDTSYTREDGINVVSLGHLAPAP